jgi:hypothetical protein
MAKRGKARWIDSEPDVIRDGDRWITFGAMQKVAAWFEFLRFSPSYELARRYRAGELAPDTSLPRDFDAVLAVYDDLGDVSREMADWWLDGAYRQFGQGGKKPSVLGLGTASSDNPEFDKIATNVERYRQIDWVAQGERTVMVVAIPVGLPKAQIAKQVALLVEQLPEDDRILSPQAPKYQITGKKLDWDSIYRYRHCLDAKADLADATLWQIGLRAILSSTYTKLLNAPNEPPSKQAEYRQALKILTSRALNRGHMIAENAARGIFPRYVKCADAMPMDWDRIGQQRENRAVDEIGDVELDAGPEFDPVWKQDSDGKWFDASAQGQKDRDRR